MYHKKLNLRAFFIAFTLVFIFTLVSFQDEAFARKAKKGLVIDGFIRNNVGFFTEDRSFTYNDDKLATFRSWFRLNFEGTFSRKLKVRVEFQAVFDPEYRIEEGPDDGKEWDRYNEWGEFDSWFREIRLEYKPFRGHYIRVGRQIVNWGEAFTARICDVINPTDGRFSLGFANLEDTRIPQWMIRGMHNLGAFGSFEWVVSPYWTRDDLRQSRGGSAADVTYMWTNPWMAAHANPIIAASASAFSPAFNPGWRFGPHPETRAGPITPAFIPAVPFAAYFGGLVPALPAAQGPPPLTRSMTYLSAAVLPFVFGPMDPLTGLPHVAGWYMLETPHVPTAVHPESSLDNTRYGFRTSHLFGALQGGVMFWHGHGGSVVYRGGIVNGERWYSILYPEVDTFGLWTNVNVTGVGMVHAEMTYTPDKAYNTYDMTQIDAIEEHDRMVYMVGIQKDVMFRKINPNQVFAIVAEYNGNHIMDYNENIHMTGYRSPVREWDSTFVFSVTTSYNYGMYGYGISGVYNVNSGNGLVSPSFTYRPDILNSKLSFKLAYTGIFASTENAFESYGLVRENDVVILTTEFYFDF